MTAPISNGPTTHGYTTMRDATGKWPEIGSFVRAKVSAVSNVCGKELAVVSVVSFRGSDPPALVLSVSGEVVGGCCEAAVAPVSAKNFALQAKKR